MTTERTSISAQAATLRLLPLLAGVHAERMRTMQAACGTSGDAMVSARVEHQPGRELSCQSC